MSLNINGPEVAPLIQRSHQTSDGGAGNLGYFQREKKKKKNDKDENDILELSTKKGEEDEIELEDNKMDSIGTKIKTFWFKINGIFNEAVIEDNEKKNN